MDDYKRNMEIRKKRKLRTIALIVEAWKKTADITLSAEAAGVSYSHARNILVNENLIKPKTYRRYTSPIKRDNFTGPLPELTPEEKAESRASYFMNQPRDSNY